jgi:hypothetical protein
MFSRYEDNQTQSKSAKQKKESNDLKQPKRTYGVPPSGGGAMKSAMCQSIPRDRLYHGSAG